MNVLSGPTNDGILVILVLSFADKNTCKYPDNSLVKTPDVGYNDTPSSPSERIFYKGETVTIKCDGDALSIFTSESNGKRIK